MKKRNINLTIKIVLLTLLLIASISGVIMMTIFLFIEPFALYYPIAIIACIIITYMAIKTMINVNSSWKKRAVDDVKNKGIGIISHWKVDEDSWTTYLEEQQGKDKSDLKTFGISALVVSTLMGLLIFYFTFELIEAIIYAIAMGIGISLFIIGLFSVSQRSQRKKLSSSVTGDIYVSEDIILMNDFLISFTQFGQSINNLRVDKDRKIPVMNVEIRTSAGQNTNYKKFSVPINIHEMDEVKKALGFLEEIKR